MRSIGTSRYTTVAAFDASRTFLGEDRVNTPTTDDQETWLSGTYGPCEPELSRIPEIASNATRDANNHVAFLAKHGWQAQITQVPPDGFLTAGVLDVLVHWIQPGTQRTLKVDGVGEFPAAKLSRSGVELRRHKASGTIYASLTTKSNDKVLLAMADRAPRDVRELNRTTDELFKEASDRHYENEGLLFPMVDLASKQQLDWLVGLQTRSRSSAEVYVIAQAVQQATLKMNHVGARARAADEMSVLRGLPREAFVINRPFLVAFQRPGLTTSLFSAYVDHDAWKNPGGLEV